MPNTEDLVGVREKIAQTIANGFRHEVGKIGCFEKIADQILALIEQEYEPVEKGEGNGKV